MMDPQKFNEYEQREAKNFILLDSSKEESTSSNLFIFIDFAETFRKVFFLGSKRLPPKSPTHSLRKSVSDKSSHRVRSASTGRDKRSELRSRHWGFLFQSLQRSVDEIYQFCAVDPVLGTVPGTVDPVLEAILVLENYIREFKALAEFFQMSWDYEKTPLPQRPQSLAWEVRKTNAVPRVRNKNMTGNSPAMSGKSSPSSYSGANSPCPTIEEYKQVGASTKTRSPDNRPKESVKVNPPMIEVTVDPVQAAKERKFEQLLKEAHPMKDESEMYQKPKSVSLENLNQAIDSSPEQFQYFYQASIQTCDSESQTEGMHDDNLTLLEYLTKYCRPNETDPDVETSAEIKAPTDIEIAREEINSKTSNQLVEQLTPVPSLSDVLKPVEIFKSPAINQTLTKAASRPTPVRANYSLRNQTITSKNPRASVESTARKSATVPHATNRPSRPPPRTSASANNIPPTRQATVLNRDNTQQKYPSNNPIRSKTMIEIPKTQQRFSLRSGELRKRQSIEDNTDSSTSTLKASNEKLGSKGSINKGSGDLKRNKKSEIKPANQSAGDGWMTVKTKRRSSWSSQRFDQPSASASLPTLLALLNENGEDSDKETSNKDQPPPKTSMSANNVKTVQKNFNSKGSDPKKDPPNHKSVTASKTPAAKPKTAVTSLASNKKFSPSVKAKVNSNAPSKRANVNEKLKAQPVTKQNHQYQNFIKRQKSDITGLKIKSLHKEYLRSEKMAPTKKIKENEEDKKVDMNLQTSTVLISQTIDNLYSELGGKKSKFTNGNLSSCDELEDDIESDDDHQKKLVEEQESLERQIRELENSEIDVDTETDETDCEAILCDLEDNESSENNYPDGRKSQSSFINEDMTLEMRYAPMLADLTQMERDETLATLQELVARDPGRAQKLHQKLSSPSRRRSFHETLKKYQAKQTRAQEKRFALQQLKAQKIQQLIQRVEQVKAAKFQLTESRRVRMEEKLQRATENRENYLKNKIKKAHDEEEKLKEIAFIKNIEMQNKRLDLLESSKEHEGRLLDLEQERFALSTLSANYYKN